jgi:hypothetical protein
MSGKLVILSIHAKSIIHGKIVKKIYGYAIRNSTEIFLFQIQR